MAANAASHRVAEKAEFQFISEITLDDEEAGGTKMMNYDRVYKLNTTVMEKPLEHL